MERPIRFAIVGCGVISPAHARSILEIPGAELAAVCDIQEEKATALAAQYCQDQARPDIYTDYHQMFERDDIDVVSVLTPSGLHASVGIDAARSGKHVLVEKPMDITLDQADLLIDACRAAGVKLGVISQHRFDPPVMTLKQAICENRLGQLNFGAAHTKWYRSQEYYDSGDWRGTWALDGGGALINQSIHYVDLLTYLMGPVEEVSAYCATRAHARIEVEDIAVAAVKFRSGALGLIEGNTAAYPGFCARLDVYGSDGSVVIENDRVKDWKFRSGEEYVAEDGPISFIGGTSSHDIWHHSHRRQIQDMVDAIMSDREPLVNGHEGRRALQIVLAIYESSRTGLPVRLN